jgi:hypothetical protein
VTPATPHGEQRPERWRRAAGDAARTLDITPTSAGLLACRHPDLATLIADVPAAGWADHDGERVYYPTTAIAYLCHLCYVLYKQSSGDRL